MEIHSYDDIKGFSAENWWYRSRRSLLDRIFKKYVSVKKDVALDLGCGTGANIESIQPYANTVIGIDPFGEALNYAALAGYDTCTEGSAENIPVSDGSIDLVLCSDVLEHVDDQRGVAELKRILKAGGKVVVTVPAFMSLWNENDDYSHHVKRYRKQELKKLFTSHGFKIKYINFWNRTFFIPMWIAARFYKKKEHGEKLENNLNRIPSWANGFLSAWMKLETVLFFTIPLPFGTSLVVVAEKI